MPPDPSFAEYGALGAVILLLVWMLKELWNAYRSETRERIIDHKEHTKDLMTGIRALDEAREHYEARDEAR